MTDSTNCLAWRKSTLSGGSWCVEIAAWRSCGGGDGDACVQAAHKIDSEKLYLMRDSKDPDGPVLAFTPAEWEAFVGGVKDGEFDDM